MEEKIEERTINKIETPRDKILLGIVILLVFIVGILLGIGIDNCLGESIRQRFIKTQNVVLETAATPTPFTDNEIVYQSKKMELLGSLFTYPSGTIESQKQNTDKIILILSSSDSVDVVIKYYRDLIALNNWKTVRVSGDTSVLKITQSDFSALVLINTVDGTTKINVEIEYPDSESITSTFNAPVMKEDVKVVPPPYAGPL